MHVSSQILVKTDFSSNCIKIVVLVGFPCLK